MSDQPALSTVDTVNLLLRMVNFLTEQLEAQAEQGEALRQAVLELIEIAGKPERDGTYSPHTGRLGMLAMALHKRLLCDKPSAKTV